MRCEKLMRRITSTKHQTPGTKLKVFTRRRISVKDGQTLKLIWECADLKISGYLLINFPLRATGNNMQPKADNNPYSLNFNPYTVASVALCLNPKNMM